MYTCRNRHVCVCIYYGYIVILYTNIYTIYTSIDVIRHCINLYMECVEYKGYKLTNNCPCFYCVIKYS